MAIILYLICLLNFDIYLTVVNSYENVTTLNNDSYGNLVEVIQHQQLNNNFTQLHILDKINVSRPIFIGYNPLPLASEYE